MNNRFKIVSVVKVINPNANPPVRFNARLEGTDELADCRITIENVTEEQAKGFAACDEKGALRTDWAGNYFPADTAFFVGAERASREEKTLQEGEAPPAPISIQPAQPTPGSTESDQASASPS